MNLKNHIKSIGFLLYGIILYLAWILLYEGIIKPRGWIDPWLTNLVSGHSAGVLNFLGFEVNHQVTPEGNRLFNEGIPVLKIAYICDGLVLYVIFLIFLVPFPGSWKNKLWFIPAGFLLIYIVNLVRVISLILIQIHTPQYLAFNHKYTFTIIVYGFIFLLWVTWVKFFVPQQTK